MQNGNKLIILGKNPERIIGNIYGKIKARVHNLCIHNIATSHVTTSAVDVIIFADAVYL